MGFKSCQDLVKVILRNCVNRNHQDSFLTSSNCAISSIDSVEVQAHTGEDGTAMRQWHGLILIFHLR